MDEPKNDISDSLLVAYQNAPPAAKAYIDSGKFEQYIGFLRTRMSLPPLVLTAVSNEILLVLLAITTPDDFGLRLSQASVPEEMIVDIEDETQKAVFEPLSAESRKNAPPRPAPTPVVPASKPVLPTPPPSINRIPPPGPPPLIPKVPPAPIVPPPIPPTPPASPIKVVPPPTPIPPSPPKPAMPTIKLPPPPSVNVPVPPPVVPTSPVVAPAPLLPEKKVVAAPTPSLPPPATTRKADPYREPIE